ncbi:MAG: NUDIX domain-containing protein [Nitritalea sp.]
MSTIQEENPWICQEKTTVFENPWIRVENHQVLNPAGKPAEYGKVCFKNRAIGILPIDADGFTYLVGQYRYTTGGYSWEIPMGGGPLEEAPLAAAKRELKEETGLSAEKWTLLMEVHTSNSATDEVGLIYVAEGLQNGTPEAEETEILQVRRLPLHEAVQMVLECKITDAISVCGLLRVARDYAI